MQFHSPVPESIGCVSFQNHYTHSLTLKFRSQAAAEQISNSKSDRGVWQTAIDRVQLMTNCHCERGSQVLVVLNRAHFLVPLENVIRLRFILRQPSPDWNQFGIQGLKIYRVPDPFHLNENTGINHTTVTSDTMEQVLQNGLCTQTDVELGHDTARYAYNVSALSYT